MGSIIKNNKGIALITALIISLVMLIFATGVLYFILQSTEMSAFGKAYATEQEAVDGAIEVTKDNMINIVNGDPVNPGIADPSVCFADAVLNIGTTCEINFPLPATSWFNNFRAIVTIEHINNAYIPGSRIEFGQAGNLGIASVGNYFAIRAEVRGPKDTVAKASALYRFVM